MKYRKRSHSRFALSLRKRRCLTGLVSVMMPRLNSINMKAAMIHLSGACSKRLNVLNLKYADIASLVAIGAVSEGREWGTPASSCLMLFMCIIFECAASKRVRRFSGSSSSEIGPSVSQVILSSASEATGVSGINSVGLNKSIMFKTYSFPFPIHCVGMSYV